LVGGVTAVASMLIVTKSDAGNGSNAICRVSNIHSSASPDPKR